MTRHHYYENNVAPSPFNKWIQNSLLKTYSYAVLSVKTIFIINTIVLRSVFELSERAGKQVEINFKYELWSQQYLLRKPAKLSNTFYSFEHFWDDRVN